MTYQQHDTVPAYEQAVFVNSKCINSDAAVKWSGSVPPPAIGTQIIATINSCGPAIVTGYFTEEGWLGLRCRLLAPPAWHVKQNKGDPNGHVFGPEFKLT